MEKHCPTPPLGQSPGKQQQLHLNVCMDMSPKLFLAPKPALGDPVSATTGQYSWAPLVLWRDMQQAESSRLWQAEEGSRSGGDTVQEKDKAGARYLSPRSRENSELDQECRED